MAIQDSVFPLARAANNIVRINRSTGVMQNTQGSFSQFLSSMATETQTLKSIKFDQKKIRKIQGLNPINTFGRSGNLLSGLTSGALDAASIIGNFFGGKKPSPKSKAGMPITKGQNVRFGGLRALGIANAVFAGLDFATGLAEGEGVGKAAAGAGGNLAGSLIGGAIGQALIPIPGLGFVLGSMAGGLAGGFLGDRAYETGEKIVGQSKLKQEEREQKQAALARSNPQNTWPSTLNKFENVVAKFEQSNFGSSYGSGRQDVGQGENPYNEPTQYPPIKETPEGEGYEGPISGDTFFPLPGGKAGEAANQQFGAPRDGGKRKHAGLDMTHHTGPLNAVVAAHKTGKVTEAVHNGYNGFVTIDHGGGFKTRYYHTTPSVKVGDIVYGGQKIANLYPDGQNTHLHFEVYRGGQPINPSSAGLGQKIGAALTAEKAKEQSERSRVSSQSGVMGQTGKPTVVLAAGTNDYLSPQTAKANVMKSIKELQQKGYNVVVVPPNESGKFADASKAVQEAAASMGATVEKGKYRTDDPLHLEMSEADRIKKKYSGAQILGDSNAVRIAGGSMKDVAGQRVTGAGTAAILQFAQGMGRVSSVAPSTQVQPMPQQTANSQQMQQMQQYPAYNLQTNRTVVLPVVQGSGKQTPRIISTPSSGQQTVLMPGPSETQVLNSLFKTILLTQLSSS